jgi:hypothetical protein
MNQEDLCAAMRIALEQSRGLGILLVERSAAATYSAVWIK